MKKARCEPLRDAEAKNGYPCRAPGQKTEPAQSKTGVKRMTTPNPRLQFAEQLQSLRIRLGNQVPTEKWTALWKAQHDRAFMVAGAAKADLLADLAGAVEGAIAGGQSIEWFRKQFDAIVESTAGPT